MITLLFIVSLPPNTCLQINLQLFAVFTIIQFPERDGPGQAEVSAGRRVRVRNSCPGVRPGQPTGGEPHEVGSLCSLREGEKK